MNFFFFIIDEELLKKIREQNANKLNKKTNDTTHLLIPPV
jgi:hypothetical protein